LTAEVVGDYALDGDTIQTTEGERIRLLAIDAPELGQPWADVSKEYLNSLVEDKKLTIKIQTTAPLDAYGRTLAIVKSHKGDCSKLLLISGLARLFIGDDAIYDTTPYNAAEILARTRKVGIWSGKLPNELLAFLQTGGK
jgi:micrococcal nuclease